MKKFLALGVFLLFVTAVSAAMNDGYTRATGGEVQINGMRVKGVGTGMPIVKFSNWNSGSGYLAVFGEFDCYQCDNGWGDESVSSVDNGYGWWDDRDSDGTCKRTSLTLSWREGQQPYGWFWVEGSNSMPVVMDSSFNYEISEDVDVHGSSSAGLSFALSGMQISPPMTWMPLSKA